MVPWPKLPGNQIEDLYTIIDNFGSFNSCRPPIFLEVWSLSKTRQNPRKSSFFAVVVFLADSCKPGEKLQKVTHNSVKGRKERKCRIKYIYVYIIS